MDWVKRWFKKSQKRKREREARIIDAFAEVILRDALAGIGFNKTVQAS